MEKVYVKDLVGEELEEEFLHFDLTEIQQVLAKLQYTEAIDLPHAEVLQQQSLRGADILCEHLSKLVKTVSYLEGKLNSVKNKAALNYTSPDGSRVTMEMRKFYAESAPDVEELQEKLAKAKASKTLLEKKFDIIMKSHYYYRDVAAGLRKTILGYSLPAVTAEPVPEGWE
jgi:hypothetical protein